MDIRVSIIVPVYNGEHYLERCIASIVAQTEQRIQVILVNDGSTDRSGMICEKWKEKDERIHVIHQQNKGLTGAWKVGVQVAQGEYVGFVDCDDYIAMDMYEKMYVAAVTNNADMVCCGIKHVFEDQDHAPWDDEMNLPKAKYESKEIIEMVYPILLNDGSFMGRGLQPNRVSKLVKRELVLGCMWLCADEVTVGEDFQFSFSIFPNVKNVVIMKGYLPYFYWVNKSSMTGAYDTEYMKKIKIMKKHLERINDYYRVYDFSKQIQNDFLCLSVLHLKAGIMEKQIDCYRTRRKIIKNICQDLEVKEALQEHTMIKISGAEKVILCFMKHHFYFGIYGSITIYFNWIQRKSKGLSTTK